MKENAHPIKKELLRLLPKVDELLKDERFNQYSEKLNPKYLVEIIREEVDSVRSSILSGSIQDDTLDIDMIIECIESRIQKEFDFGLKKVINGTGVVLHTNLGRAPMAKEAQAALDSILYGYCNLEYEIDNGVRGSRHDHLKSLLQKLTGAEDVIVVNNNAAAVMLVLSTMAKGKEVIVSRGELVEIGGSFRIPRVMEHSGAALREVGSTNKTHAADYEEAINENTAALMKVHTSNFKVLGFTDSVDIADLRTIADKYSLPIIEDLGSGVFLDLRKYGLEYEPTVMDSLAKGADIVTFSGDKLMGGAQCGVIVGKKEYIAQMKKNNLLRALRVDKMTIAALTATLSMYLNTENIEEKIPVLSMLSKTAEALEEKAQILCDLICNQKPELKHQVEKCKMSSMVGGGSLPTQLMDSYGLQIQSTKISTSKLEQLMRITPPHIVGRVEENCYYLDVRTIFDEEIEMVADKLTNLLDGAPN